MDITFLELVGYAASVAVVLSFVMKDMVKLRIFNMIGCALFVIYGLMFESIRDGLPIIATNMIIIVINSYFLYKMMLEKKP